MSKAIGQCFYSVFSVITPVNVQPISVISVPDLYTISSEHTTCGYVKPKAMFAVMSLQI